MLDFLKAIEKQWSSIEIIKLTSRDINFIKKIVISNLNLSNENELRDKFEGIAFYEKFLLKASGILALEKLLNKALLDWENVTPKNFVPVIEINNKEVYISTTKFGEFPINNVYPFLPTLVFIKKDVRTIWLLGVLKPEIYSQYDKISSFENLVLFENYEDLKNFLK